MGVYIKGMEMPIDGNETIIRIQPDGTVLDQYGHHLAITAVPVPPHGRWNNIIQGIIPSGQCSNCGAWDKVTRFCPNCGSQMEGAT
jgi:hypothetical protein